MAGYTPHIIWAGPIRRMSAKCSDCPWSTEERAAPLARKHLTANPSHHVTVTATAVTVFSTLGAPERVSHAS